MVKPDLDKVEAWIKALRSGKYRQGTKALMTKQGNCCLGVYCLINDIPVCEVESTDDIYKHHANGGGFINDIAYDRLRDVELGAMMVADCIEWNDDKRYSFSQIADKLEEYLNGQTQEGL